ncbi:hypothetical protein B0T17DRAFT_147061 [Bombardia bombarda]|uniref:Uncharacterized protein n=1 Tax=Bombardia bombarda TaxID=252184 RepID=A0AA39X6M6_9PEZI|nr:hypothetical protein B0T17DRAFT_147061 [Bombardia bombarda]
MSSPGQIAAPQGRPPSGLTASAFGSQRSQTSTAYGQDCHYAETWENPPPEFVVGSGQTAAGLAATNGAGSGHDGDATGQGGALKEFGAQGTVWTPPAEDPWYKKVRKAWWIGGIVTVLGITGVILAILGAMDLLTNHPMSDTASLATSSSMTGSSTTPTTTTAVLSASSSATSIPAVCSDNEHSFHSDVGFVFLTGSGTAFNRAESVLGCCAVCQTTPNCAAWIYDSSTSSTPCAQVLVNLKNANVTNQCPNGKVAAVQFTGGGTHTAYTGPCANAG